MGPASVQHSPRKGPGLESSSLTAGIQVPSLICHHVLESCWTPRGPNGERSMVPSRNLASAVGTCRAGCILMQHELPGFSGVEKESNK